MLSNAMKNAQDIGEPKQPLHKCIAKQKTPLDMARMFTCTFHASFKQTRFEGGVKEAIFVRLKQPSLSRGGSLSSTNNK